MLGYFINEGVIFNGVFYDKHTDPKITQEVMYQLRIISERLNFKDGNNKR